MSEVKQERRHDREPRQEARGPVVATLREPAGEMGEERTEQVVLLTPAIRERLLILWARVQDFAVLELQARREYEQTIEHVLAALGLPGPANQWEIHIGDGKLRRRIEHFPPMAT